MHEMVPDSTCVWEMGIRQSDKVQCVDSDRDLKNKKYASERAT